MSLLARDQMLEVHSGMGRGQAGRRVARGLKPGRALLRLPCSSIGLVWVQELAPVPEPTALDAAHTLGSPGIRPASALLNAHLCSLPSPVQPPSPLSWSPAPGTAALVDLELTANQQHIPQPPFPPLLGLALTAPPTHPTCLAGSAATQLWPGACRGGGALGCLWLSRRPS